MYSKMKETFTGLFSHSSRPYGWEKKTKNCTQEDRERLVRAYEEPDRDYLVVADDTLGDNRSTARGTEHVLKRALLGENKPVNVSFILKYIPHGPNVHNSAPIYIDNTLFSKWYWNFPYCYSHRTNDSSIHAIAVLFTHLNVLKWHKL